MSVGDPPGRHLPTPSPARVPGPAPGERAAPASHRVLPDEVVDVLAALEELREGASVLDAAVLLEDAQERLALLLSGAAR